MKWNPWRLFKRKRKKLELDSDIILDSLTKTEQDLVNEAERGLRGQGSAVMSMFILKRSIDRLDDTSTHQQATMIRLTWSIAILTVVIAIFTVVMAFRN